MPERNGDESREVQEEPIEDLDVDPALAEDVRGGNTTKFGGLTSKMKTAEKNTAAINGLIRG